MSMDNKIIIFVMVCFVIVMIWIELVARIQDSKIKRLEGEVERLRKLRKS